MKKYTLFATALALASCTNDNGNLNTSNEQVAIRLSSSLEMTTRAATDIQSTALDAGESVDVFITEDAQTPTTTYTQPLTYTTGENGAMNPPTGEQPYFPTSGNGVNIYAYYPAGTVTDMSASAVTFTVEADQSTDANYKASDLMYGEAENPVTRTSASIPVTFRHLLSKVTVELTSGEGSPDVTDATVSLVNIRLDATLTPSTGEVAAGEETQDQSVTVTTGTEGSAIIPVQTVDAGSKFIQVHLSDGADLYYELPREAAFQSGYVYSYNIKVNLTSLEVISNITDWTTDDEYSGDDNGEAVMPTPIVSLTSTSCHADVFGNSSYSITLTVADNVTTGNITVTRSNENDTWVGMQSFNSNVFTFSVDQNYGSARSTSFIFSAPGYADAELYITQDGIPEIVTGIDEDMIAEGWNKGTSSGVLGLNVEPEASEKELSYSIDTYVDGGTLSVEIPTDAQEWLRYSLNTATDSTGVIYFIFADNMKLARSTAVSVVYTAKDVSGMLTTSSDVMTINVTQDMVDINPGDYFCVENYGSSSPGDWYIYNKTKAISGIPQNEVVGIVFSNNTDKIGAGEKAALGGTAHGLVIATKYADASISQMSPMSAWSNSTYFGENRVSTIAGAFDEMEGYANTTAVWNHTYYKENTGLLNPSGSAEGSLFPTYKVIKNCNDGENNNIYPVPSTTTGWFMPSIGQLLEFYEQLSGTTLSSARSSDTDPSDDLGYFAVSVNNTALNEWMQYLENKHDFYSTDRLTGDTFLGFCSSSVYNIASTTGYIYHPSLGFVDASNGRIRLKSDPECHYEVRPVLAF